MLILVALYAGVNVESVGVFDSPVPLMSPLKLYLPIVQRAPEPNIKGVGAIWQYPYTCADLELIGAEQFHDWTPWPLDCEGIEPVCQWWGLNSINLSTNPRCNTIILWNEPDISGQANFDPFVGATHWTDVEQAAGDREITTPCAGNLWLTQWANAFYAAHNRWPEFDYVCVHSYPYLMPGMTTTPVQQTKNAIESARNWSTAHGGDGSVWLHEFGMWPAWCPDEDCVTEYIEGIVPWLDEQQVPYNWFALRNVGDYMAPPYDTSLVEGGALTAYGEAFR